MDEGSGQDQAELFVIRVVSQALATTLGDRELEETVVS